MNLLLSAITLAIDDLAKAKGIKDIQEAGVTRAKFFRKTEDRIPLRVHDLRAKFVTLDACQRQDRSVGDATHGPQVVDHALALQAGGGVELKLGWFTPLHDAIPQLAAMEKDAPADGGAGPSSSEPPEGAPQPTAHRLPA